MSTINENDTPLYTALLPPHHNTMNTHSSNNNNNTHRNTNDNHANIQLHTTNGYTFRVHPSTAEVAEDGYTYSCHPFHREVTWSFTKTNINNNLNWCMQSELLLEITYRPAYQALPEYTSMAESYSMAKCKQLTSKVCCVTSSKYYSNRNIDFVREVYTYEDIVSFRYLDEFHLKGVVGPCQAVEIVLQSKERYYHYDSNAVDNTTANKNSNMMHDACYKVENPSVIFALPKDWGGGVCPSCPPLLWKAKIASDPSIAVQTITVFDGMLVTREDEDSSSFINSTYDYEHGPTHIYCNGWQSWSFAGSVPRGTARPSSAMPRFLSKAFNRGGKFPPPAMMHMHHHAVQRLRRLQSKDEPIHNGFDEKSISYHRNGRTAQLLPERQSSRYKSEFFVCLTQSKVSSSESRAENDIGMLDENGGPALVMGWLSQRRQFGVVAVDDSLRKLAMHCPCDGAIATTNFETDWAYCQIMGQGDYNDEPLASYVETVADYCSARAVLEPLSVGWCSWYHYYEKIDEKMLKENFLRMKELRAKFSTNIALIDDGFMVSWGDWDNLKPNKFTSSNSMKELAISIKEGGMRPGLWLAPFACDKNSQLARNHPDWIIRNHQGVPANSANCGKFFYGLDATNPAVLKHAADIVRKAVHEWGYEVLKLDFLYASCLAGNGKYDLTMTRAETMCLALQTLREAAGDKAFIIGCGCPLGPAIGFIDGMRISADTGPTWKPKFPLPWWDWSTLPCLFAMIRNSMTRMVLGYRWWHNDPDCILLGKSTSLNNQEIKSAATVIAMSGGMLLLSDDLPALSKDRLDIASKIFPVTGSSAIPLDLHCANDVLPSKLRVWCSDKNDVHESFACNRNTIKMADGLGAWGCISIGNWKDSTDTMRIPLSAFLHNHSNNNHTYGYHAFSFWNQNYVWIPQRSTEKPRSISKHLGPHESEVFHVKPVSRSDVQYIGSDFHFSCGFEIDSFVLNNNIITLQLKLSLQRSGHVFLFIPLDCNVEVTVCGSRFAVDYITKIPLQDDENIQSFGNIIRIPAFVKLDGNASDGKMSVRMIM